MTRHPLKHEVISASAGSGKTFQLVNRYLQLLINYEVKAEQIVALTFSRKAAAEIFDSIIQRLAEASTNEKKRDELQRQIGSEPIEQNRLIGLLRTVIHQLHRLRISTYDSFFSWIIKSFPLEFGMGGDFDILTPEQEQLQNHQIITRLLKNPDIDRAFRSTFFAAFKQATFGKQEKRLASLLNDFVTTYREYFLDVPDSNLWGNREVIWPNGCRWFNNRPDLKALSNAMKDTLASQDLNDKQIKKWISFLEEAEQFSEHTPMTANLRYLLVKLIAVLDELYQGHADITVLKRQHLDRSMCSYAAQIVEGIIRYVLQGQLEKTMGIHRILHHYEQRYDRLVRQSGRLSFRDIEYLLGGGAGEDRRFALTQEGTADNRLYIDYRLDSRFDHWLLDEFQDTSNRQWLVLANMIDEILQDDSGTRSFFYVGDSKQAIHGWRGGDVNLFTELYETYNQDGEHISRKPLATSYRSSPEIIDAVNQIFSPDNLSPLPTTVVEKWKKSWRKHSTARSDLRGYVCLIQTANHQGADRRDVGLRGEVLVNILKKLPHRSANLSIAVLVRNNKTGRLITNILRDNDIPSTWEGDAGIVDNPVTTVLLSLLKVARHPGDMYAFHHVMMTPLGDCISELNLRFPDLVLLVNRQLHHHGFAYTIDLWYRRLRPRIVSSKFGKYRMTQLLEVARTFDQSGNRNVLDFIDLIGSYSISDSSEAGSVRVMTIHKSKGLGFDVVLLPDLQFGGITSSGQIDLGVSRQTGINARADWVLSMPIRAVAAADPVLSNYVTRADAEHCYEELCLLYVAITRAKRGLYMITTAQRDDSTAIYQATLIENALSHQKSAEDITNSEVEYIYQTGNLEWYVPFSMSTNPVPSGPVDDRRSYLPLRRQFGEEPIRHIKPSGLEQRVLSAGQLFSLTNRESAGTGTAIHSLFEQVEWLDTIDIERLLKNWRNANDFRPEIAEKAINEFLSAIEKPNMRRLMQNKPEKSINLWREKRFDIVLDNHLVSGSFDRVVLLRDTERRFVAATIIDFKTDRIDANTDHSHHITIYKPQLDLYRKVLAVMTDLPEAKITCQLAFTKTDRIIEV